MRALPDDTYYRGYRLSEFSDATFVFYQDRFVEKASSGQEAKDDIDAWHDAG